MPYSSVAGPDSQTTALVLAVQTAGEALNFNLDFAKTSSEQATFGDPAVALAKADTPARLSRRRDIRCLWKVYPPALAALNIDFLGSISNLTFEEGFQSSSP